MPKTYSYNLELKDDPNTWLVYKEEVGMPDTRIGYLVELNHYGDVEHRCSCPHGEHQKWEPGKRLVRCKHIEMVLDEEFRRKNKSSFTAPKQ